ncbi:MAG TPA: methyltransferase [Candidatus Dormibacteraeota bacterium]|nr:methyltransferase [Candidatus Dormibacteraeota bacterium]
MTVEARAAAMRLITAAWDSQCVRVAVELGVIDRLDQRGPLTTGELATAVAGPVSAPHLARMLRALATLEVLCEMGDGRYALTPTGRELRTAALGPVARFFMSDVQWQNWMALSHSIRTGERAFDHVQGMRNWDYYAAHPTLAAMFDAAMAAMTAGTGAAIAASYDFGRFPVVADVGGGGGTLLVEILRRHPNLRGVLFDREHVVERARPALAAAGVLDRCELVGGDFTVAVDVRADAIVLKSVLHDWGDPDAVAILRRLGPASAVLVVERVLPERVGPDNRYAALSDLNMMVNNGGRERTAREFEALAADAGLRMARVVPTPTPFSVVEVVARG